MFQSPVVNRPAWKPSAMLLSPSVFLPSALYPLAVLPAPVMLLLSASDPLAVLA